MDVAGRGTDQNFKFPFLEYPGVFLAVEITESIAVEQDFNRTAFAGSQVYFFKTFQFFYRTFLGRLHVADV